jgi:hypothetical protein
LYFDAYTFILRGHSGSCDADGSVQFTAARPSARAAASFYPHQWFYALLPIALTHEVDRTSPAAQVDVHQF